MAKLITRIGFDQMDRDQFNAFFEFMDFTKELAKQTGDPRALNHAHLQCERLSSLFESILDDLGRSNVIPFKGGKLHD